MLEPSVTQETNEVAETQSSSFASPTSTSPEEPQMTRLRFVLVYLSMMLCVFLFALDQLIVVATIPKVVSQFNSLGQVAWLANAFFLSLTSTTLLFGQVLHVFTSKWIYLGSLFVFELGSLICGLSPNMNVLIVGRAIAGLGGSGIYSATFQAVTEITTLQERPTYLALFGACSLLASILGPIIGGVLVDHASWRWCYYVNLPVGGVAFLCLLLIFKARPPLGSDSDDKRSLYRKIIHLDWIGTALASAFTAFITVAFAWGGVEKPWSSPDVVAFLVMIPVSFGLLVSWTLWVGKDRAMLPLGLLGRRSIIGATGLGLMGLPCFMACIYYLSIQDQAVNGHSSTRAGFDLLSLIVVNGFTLIVIGKLTGKTGRYKWLAFAGCLVQGLACGLIFGTNASTKYAQMQGLQVLLAIGLGSWLSNSIVAVQVELKSEPHLISRGVGAAQFFGFQGRIIGISVATAIFNNRLPQELRFRAPGLSDQQHTMVTESILAIRTSLPEELRAGVVDAYRLAISPIFLYCMATSFAAAACCLLIKNDSSISPSVGLDTTKDMELGAGRRGEGGPSREEEDDASKDQLARGVGDPFQE